MSEEITSESEVENAKPGRYRDYAGDSWIKRFDGSWLDRRGRTYKEAGVPTWERARLFLSGIGLREWPFETQTYRKKPVSVETMRWDGTSEGATPIIDWILSTGLRTARYHDAGDTGPGTTDFNHIAIDTLEGTMTARPGDIIIRGVHGEFYPCKPEIFEETYESETPGKITGITDSGIKVTAIPVDEPS